MAQGVRGQRYEAAFTEKQLSEGEALEAKIAELERFCGKLALENDILKKRVVEIPLHGRHLMIEEAALMHPELSLSALCKLFGASRSWYYEKPTREQKAQRDLDLRDAIERIVLEFPGYGYRRVTKALERDGWQVNHKRVLRVMREESLLCQLQRGFKVTTDSNHSLRRYPNLLKEAIIDAPDRAWVADITYVRLPTTFC